MFESKDGKKLEKGMLVALHFNAHRKDFSVVEMKSQKTIGKVLGYIKQGVIENAYQLILLSGQKSVRECQVKNRHAYLVGNWKAFELFNQNELTGNLYYNPYKIDYFVDGNLFKENNEVQKVESCQYVQFDTIISDGKIKPIVSYIK